MYDYIKGSSKGIFKDYVSIDNQGIGYDNLNPPSIVFANPPSGGVTATGVPVIKDGKIIQIKMTNIASVFIKWKFFI